MKKITICLMLLASSFYTHADNKKCAPNLTNQDMCIYAKKIADELQKELPIKNSEDLYMVAVKTDNVRVIVTGEMKSTLSNLEKMYGYDYNNIEKAKNVVRSSSKKAVCSDKYLTSFINLGGVIQYEYVFSDGKLFDIVAVTSCK